MATSRDVAKLAGVSVATVSRTFAKRNSVSEKTAQQVLAAAQQLGYTPNDIARSLKSNKTNTVGLVISNIYNPFFFQTAAVMSRELEKHNYKILLSFNKEYDESMYTNIQNLLSAKVDAIAFTPIISDSKLPQILCNRDIYMLQLLGNMYPEFDSILFDDYSTTCEITQYLLDRGHTKIMMIASTEDRKYGMLDTLKKNHVSLFPGNYVSILHVNSPEDVIEQALLTYRPTAVIVVAQTTSQAFMRVIKRRNFRIPEDLSVIGYDDDALLELNDITSVGHDIEHLGREASALLLNHLEQKTNTPFPMPQHHLLKTKFIERKSVKILN